MNTKIADLIRTGNNEALKRSIEQDPSLAAGAVENGPSYLLFAAYCRNHEAVEILSEKKQEKTIFEAAAIGDLNLLKMLAEKDEKIVNSFSPDGFTPLGLASFFGFYEGVDFLLKKGADPNLPAQNSFKVAPLHSACAISNYEIAKLLLKNGAEVNVAQAGGVTPLHSAAHNGQDRLVQLLLEHGADTHAKTEDGKTPLQMAEEEKHTSTARLLE
ncbi:ankyrin repeat domain-containing protein [Salinimicrobium soli]|uniref:ankyrin repeat domain-containing protein n=1 Tax=Salinimicrobium soli TaxID=1254399 RepID=UPI003AAC34CE